MRKFYILLIGLIMMFSLSSCVTPVYTTTQDDIYVENIDYEVDIVHSNVSFDIIFTYGIPYFMNGEILYYFYKGIYYYPFYYNNYWYIRAYRRPFIHLNYRPYFRPHRYDYRFSPGRYLGYDRPHSNHPHNQHMRRPDRMPQHHNPHMNRPQHQRPNNPHMNRPQHQNNRHMQHQRPQRIDQNQNNRHRGVNHGGRR